MVKIKLNYLFVLFFLTTTINNYGLDSIKLKIIRTYKFKNNIRIWIGDGNFRESVVIHGNYTNCVSERIKGDTSQS